MSNLVESILSEDYVSASSIFEARLNEIAENKLVEMKKYMQAEGVGGLTAAQIQARKELGWKKASDVLPDPRDVKIGLGKSGHKKKPVIRRKKIKEDIDRAAVEKEKAKLRQTHPDVVDSPPEVSPAVQHPPRDASAIKTDAPKKSTLSPAHKKLKSDKEQHTMSTSDRYQIDLQRAKELKRRGSKTAVSRVRKAYAGHRAKREIGNFGSFMKGLGSNIISGLGEDTETK